MKPDHLTSIAARLVAVLAGGWDLPGLRESYRSPWPRADLPLPSSQPMRWRFRLPRFANWSLRCRLIAMVLALSLPLNLVIAAVVWSLAGAARDAQKASLLYTARAIASGLDAELSKYIALANALSRSPALLADDLGAFDREARRTFDGIPDAWVVVAGLDGRQLLNTASGRRETLPNGLAASLEQQRRAFETGRPVISGLRNGPYTHRWVTVIDIPVYKDGRPYRALAVTVAAKSFLGLFNAREMPKNWIAGIIDEHGRYITRVPDHDLVVGGLASEGWRRTAGHAGLSEFKSREGDPVVNANDVSTFANWTVGIGIKKSELNAAAWRATRWAAVLGLSLSLLSLLLAMKLARHLSRHLSELSANAKTLLTLGPQTAAAPTVPELADVWGALRSAADDRDRSQEKLRRSYETYFRLIKNAAFGVYLVDADFRLAEVSVGAQSVFANVRPLLNRDFGEVLRAIWSDAFASEIVGIFRRTFDTGEPYQSANTREVRKDTGDLEAYDWRIERVGLPDGRFGVVCYFYDLSERLRHEEHVRLLMQELNHRSKNMIGLVQSIARHTKAGSVDEFVRRFGQRLQALATNQDILVTTEQGGAYLEGLAKAQLATFGDTLGGRIKVSGPSLMLNAAAAQAIGMALHELATNAAKYGALSNDDGRVDVSWSIDDGKLTCTWSERGGPCVVAPSRNGFGSTVIKDMVRMSVGGVVLLTYPATGFSWYLECPLEKVAVATRPAV